VSPQKRPPSVVDIAGRGQDPGLRTWVLRTNRPGQGARTVDSRLKPDAIDPAVPRFSARGPGSWAHRNAGRPPENPALHGVRENHGHSVALAVPQHLGSGVVAVAQVVRYGQGASGILQAVRAWIFEFEEVRLRRGSTVGTGTARFRILQGSGMRSGPWAGSMDNKR